MEHMTIFINGKKHIVEDKYPAATKLVDFLRDEVGLTGTKFMCRAGFCGSCVVTASFYDPVAKQTKSKGVNACLMPLYGLSGYHITTVEGVGGRIKGYHPIQQRLTEFSGSQCGYCSPGMVMNMYSLLQRNPIPTYQQIEDEFDGNICRCTGYRPIIEAMKTFGRPQVSDIEDLNDWVVYGTCNSSCISPCKENLQCASRPLEMKLVDGQWFHPTNIKELLNVLKDVRTARYRFVVGNTGYGIFRDEDDFDIFIDLKGVLELYAISTTGPFKIGANVSLEHLIEIFTNKRNDPAYQYCGPLAELMKEVANVHVRNIACWAGNLMLKRHKPNCPFDVFTALECLGAQIILNKFDGTQKSVSTAELLNFPMNGWFIREMILPRLSNQYYFITFKVKRRNQNAVGYMDAAFLFQLDSSKNFKIVSKPSIVYGGISGNFIHAKKTEALLVGKELGDENTLQMAIAALNEEVVPVVDPDLSAPQHRRLLACTLFYKMCLKIVKRNVSKRFVSGGELLHRPLSTSKQDYSTVKPEWPLTQPMPKLESLVQCSGELKYTADYPKPKDTLFAAFVISTVGNATIQSVNTEAAMKLPGVIRYFDFKDIPGENDITAKFFFWKIPEELFCSGQVQYNGQPIGMIVADTCLGAQTAAAKVEVKYTNIKPAVTTIRDAIKAGRLIPEPDYTKHEGNPDEALRKSRHKVSGELFMGSQYAYHLETQTAFCIPRTDCFQVLSSTQWPSGVQTSIAQVLKMKKSFIDVTSQYVGGAFGAKTHQGMNVAAAAALAAYKLDKPVLMQLDYLINMKCFGKRYPLLVKYEASFTDDAILDAIKLNCYYDVGFNNNGALIYCHSLANIVPSTYVCPNIHVDFTSAVTDKPSNIFVRAPGTLNAIFVMEYIITRGAVLFEMNPTDIKLKNLVKTFTHTIPKEPKLVTYKFQDLFQELLRTADVSTRNSQIAVFNKENRWRKKSLAVCPMRYPFAYAEKGVFTVLVSIFKDGGSVAVSHGGVELGQGINTKIAQVCAFELGIPMNKITIKQNSSLANPNSTGTLSSTTSELNCAALILCCQELRKRMEPVKKKMLQPTWEQLVDECHEQGIDLGARAMIGPGNYPPEYWVYAAAAAEVEVDILTGLSQINRVDLLYDVGESMSPLVDLGQVEGGFVMASGYYLTEEINYDSQTALNTTATPFSYQPPSFKDTPIDFRISFLKNAPNPHGVLSSKATGEPALLVAAAVFWAAKAAVRGSKLEDNDKAWFQMSTPATAENILLTCNLQLQSFTYQEKKPKESVEDLE